MNSLSAPSLCTPSVWLNWQALLRPRLHDAHSPQLMYGETATLTPAARAGFELCPETIVAATSCPGIRGNVTSGFFPRNEFKSLPQRPTILTFSNRLPLIRTRSGTFSILASPGFLITSAFTFAHLPQQNRPFMSIIAVRWEMTIAQRFLIDLSLRPTPVAAASFPEAPEVPQTIRTSHF